MVKEKKGFHERRSRRKRPKKVKGSWTKLGNRRSFDNKRQNYNTRPIRPKVLKNPVINDNSKNYNHNSSFGNNNSWEKRFHYTDSQYRNVRSGFEKLLLDFNQEMFFDDYSEEKISTELLNFLDKKELIFPSFEIPYKCSVNFIDNQHIVSDKTITENKTGSDIIIEVNKIKDEIVTEKTMFLIQSKKVINQKVPELENNRIDKSKYKFLNSMLEADKFLQDLVLNNRDQLCPNKSLSQALKMMCLTGKDQSFFLFFKNEENFGQLGTALDILKWRTNWFNILKTTKRNSTKGFTGIENISDHINLINLSEYLTYIILNKPKKAKTKKLEHIRGIKRLQVNLTLLTK